MHFCIFEFFHHNSMFEFSKQKFEIPFLNFGAKLFKNFEQNLLEDFGRSTHGSNTFGRWNMWAKREEQGGPPQLGRAA